MITAGTPPTKKCPVWDHECYGVLCQAWNPGGYCNIIAAKSFQPVNVCNIPIYRPSCTANGSGHP